MSQTAQNGILTLEDYLKPHPLITKFFENNDFWERYQFTAQIPLDDLMVVDPTAFIIGKEDIIHEMKKANYDAMQIQQKRLDMFWESRMLGFEHAYQRKHWRKEVDAMERKFKENNGDLDREGRIKHIIASLEESGKYQRQRTPANLMTNRLKAILELDVDYDAMAREHGQRNSRIKMVYLEGDKGSGKSILQEQLMESYRRLCASHGVRGFEYMVIPNPRNPDKPKLVKLIEGEAQEIMSYFDARQEKIARAKKWAIGGAIVAVAYPIAHFFSTSSAYELTGRYSWNNSDMLKQLGSIIKEYSIHGLLAIATAAGVSVAGAWLHDRKKKKDKRPNIVSRSEVMAYDDGISMEELIGEFKSDSERPIQESITAGSLNRGNGKGVIIEQLSELEQGSVQSQFGEILSGMIQIGKDQFTTDFNTLLYIGQNPFQKHKLTPQLIDRLNPAIKFEVSNNVPKTERTKKQFAVFLEYHRQLENGPSFHRGAVEKAMEISTLLSEDTGMMEISRRFTPILDKAISYAKEEGSNAVYARHVTKAAAVTRSANELKLEERLRTYYSRKPAVHEHFKTGSVNVIAYLTDVHLVEKQTNDPYQQQELAQWDGMGYLLNIRASANQRKAQGLAIIAPKGWDEKQIDFYKGRLEHILIQNSIDDSKYNGITVDISDALCEDDAIIPGMFAAVKSVIESVKIDQDMALVAQPCYTSGNLQHPVKINKRLFTYSNTAGDYKVRSIFMPSDTLGRVVMEGAYDFQFKEIGTLGNIKALNGLRQVA